MTEARLVALLLCGIALAMLGLATGLVAQARHAPLAVLLPTAGLLIFEIGRMLLRPQKPRPVGHEGGAPLAARIRRARRDSRGADTTHRRRELTFLAWLAVLIAGFVLVGPALGAAAFLLAAIVVGIALPRAVGLRMPTGLLTGMLGAL
jgi:hypothetical protein